MLVEFRLRNGKKIGINPTTITDVTNNFPQAVGISVVSSTNEIEVTESYDEVMLKIRIAESANAMHILVYQVGNQTNIDGPLDAAEAYKKYQLLVNSPEVIGCSVSVITQITDRRNANQEETSSETGPNLDAAERSTLPAEGTGGFEEAT